MNNFVFKSRFASALGLVLMLAASQGVADEVRYKVLDKDGKALQDYVIPKDADIANHENSEQILYGKRLLNETKRLMPDYVGAYMNCNSCHIEQGKKPQGAPYINTVNSFPQMNPRAERIFQLEDRINGCMQRSMNGKPLADDSKEMQAMIAYMKWLAQEVPHGAKVQIQNSGPLDTSLTPDPIRGARIYAQQCAACHGKEGEGTRDASGEMAFPPLWGEESFNLGAGMARTYKAAAFIKYNMPMGVNSQGNWGEGGVLDDQDAVDVAEFFTHQPRPDYPDKIYDFPSGKRPKDFRN
ncbi:c-type cytochrome [Oceanisphaera avium]|uniref:Cytochrome C n=1 Tax=Oceanisphaera avium TaxID=1903694 RepID=A0A1Y0CVF9_9GAMM|nr:c-type cytochrome [Oceanisphaera avium]ART79330.1 cytochrome C [Oceanisphaera avium]